MKEVLFYLVLTVSSPDTSYIREIKTYSEDACLAAKKEWLNIMNRKTNGYGWPSYTAICVRGA